jgi:hypothetical protein
MSEMIYKLYFTAVYVHPVLQCVSCICYMHVETPIAGEDRQNEEGDTPIIKKRWSITEMSQCNYCIDLSFIRAHS